MNEDPYRKETPYAEQAALEALIRMMRRRVIVLGVGLVLVLACLVLYGLVDSLPEDSLQVDSFPERDVELEACQHRYEYEMEKNTSARACARTCSNYIEFSNGSLYQPGLLRMLREECDVCIAMVATQMPFEIAYPTRIRGRE